MRVTKLSVGSFFAVVLFTLAGCASIPGITGTWTASDGSPTKIISDGGSCSGMYYNGKVPLDIGGPETCALSGSDSSGPYKLVVRQAPNQETFDVAFGTDNTMTLSLGGTEIVTLTKQ